MDSVYIRYRIPAQGQPDMILDVDYIESGRKWDSKSCTNTQDEKKERPHGQKNVFRTVAHHSGVYSLAYSRRKGSMYDDKRTCM